MDTPKRRPVSESMRELGALSTVGLTFVFAMIIGAAVGWWLDRQLGTAPWLFIVFFFFGLAAGVLNVYRTAGKFIK